MAGFQTSPNGRFWVTPEAISASGTFGSVAPFGAYTAPNLSWSFSFLIDSNPVPIGSTSGGARLPISAFEYRLGGSLVAVSPTFADFYTPIVGNPRGGFNISSMPLDFQGAALFSGSPGSPTIQPGTYTGELLVGRVFVPAAVTISSEVPEPGSVGLCLIGLVGLGLLRRRTRR
jgi:hypothetical protein